MDTKIIVGTADVTIRLTYNPALSQQYIHFDEVQGVTCNLHLEPTGQPSITIAGGQLSNITGRVSQSAFINALHAGLSTITLSEKIKQDKKRIRLGQIKTGRLLEFEDGSQVIIYERPIPTPHIQGETKLGDNPVASKAKARTPDRGKEKIFASEFRPNDTPNLTHWHYPELFYCSSLIDIVKTESPMVIRAEHAYSKTTC